MSQPNAPAETIPTNPVGTQEVSPGEPQKPSPEQLASASQALHDKTQNGNAAPTVEDVKTAVAEALKDEFAVTSGWQPRMVVKFVINCPSGQKVLVKHLDTTDLMRAKMLEEMDIFAKQLFPSRIDETGTPVDDEGQKGGLAAILDDPKRRMKFLDLTNRLISAASVRPRVVNDGVALRTTENGEEIDVFGHEVTDMDEQLKLFGKPVPKLGEGEAYAGAIRLEDRMAFFQELNKPLELIQPFREGSDAVLASVESSQSSTVPTERPV